MFGRGAVAVVAATALLAIAGCSAAPALRAAGEPGPGIIALKNSVDRQGYSLSIDDLAPVAEPTTIELADLDIDMSIEPHGLESNGDMSLPVSPFVAGWYEFGSAPDSRRGAIVLAAHVDSLAEGIGPFSRLKDAREGMVVEIVDDAGESHRYEVQRVERIEKDEVNFDEVFTDQGETHLVLITCGGVWDRDRSSYTDNYIVTARPVT